MWGLRVSIVMAIRSEVILMATNVPIHPAGPEQRIQSSCHIMQPGTQVDLVPGAKSIHPQSTLSSAQAGHATSGTENIIAKYYT